MNKYFWFREKTNGKWGEFYLVMKVAASNDPEVLFFFGNEQEKSLSSFAPGSYEIRPLREKPPDWDNGELANWKT